MKTIKAIYKFTGEFLEITVGLETYQDKPIVVRYKRNEEVWYYDSFIELFNDWYFIQGAGNFGEEPEE